MEKHRFLSSRDLYAGGVVCVYVCVWCRGEWHTQKRHHDTNYSQTGMTVIGHMNLCIPRGCYGAW